MGERPSATKQIRTGCPSRIGQRKPNRAEPSQLSEASRAGQASRTKPGRAATAAQHTTRQTLVSLGSLAVSSKVWSLVVDWWACRDSARSARTVNLGNWGPSAHPNSPRSMLTEKGGRSCGLRVRAPSRDGAGAHPAPRPAQGELGGPGPGGPAPPGARARADCELTDSDAKHPRRSW